MRLWGACLFVASLLMLLPLQSAVTACDCDFTATISLDDRLAGELANETFLYTELNLSDRESIKNILENSEKIQSILEYFGINEDGLMFNDSLVIMINETDRYVMVPLNLTTGNQWNVTVNVTNEETNETTPMTFIGDFAAVNAYISGGEVINANWLEIEKIAGGLLYTLSNGNKTIDVATSDELGIGVTSGGVTVSGVMWDTQDGNSTNESATPPPQPTGFLDCMKNCLWNRTRELINMLSIPIPMPIGGALFLIVLGIAIGIIIKHFIENHPVLGGALLGGSIIAPPVFTLGSCWNECNGSDLSSIDADIYVSNEESIITYQTYADNVETFTVTVDKNGEINVETGER